MPQVSAAAENASSILTARPYQEELLMKAKQGNSIVFLGTGGGKTFIASMMIRESAHQVRP